MQRLIWILLALVSCAAAAASENARDRVEASTVVTGWVEVAPDGSVYNYTLDQQNKLDAGVVNLIARTIGTWKFKPVLIDDKPVLARAKMNLRVVATKHGKDEFEIRVRGATFGDGQPNDGPNYKDRKPPLYPIMAIKAQTEGTVYLALEVDRTGRVERAVAQQVDLRQIGSENDMRLLRRAFAKSSVEAATGWTFNIPTTGPGASEDHWTVRVPINFTLSAWGEKPRDTKYGQWDVYVPGPVQPVPWEQDGVAGSNNADAVADDGLVFTPDKRFVLLTPPSS